MERVYVECVFVCFSLSLSCNFIFVSLVSAVLCLCVLSYAFRSCLFCPCKSICFLEFLFESCSCAPSQFLVRTDDDDDDGDDHDSLLLLLYSPEKPINFHCILFHRRFCVLLHRVFSVSCSSYSIVYVFVVVVIFLDWNDGHIECNILSDYYRVNCRFFWNVFCL